MSHHFFASLIVALSRKESGMKKFIVMLLGVTATLAGQAAAQGPVEMIASDGGGGVYLQAVDGSKNAFVGDALEPAWSPDGSRIAFVRYSQPGLFVLKLGDWSFVNVRNRGTSPAWSPDGRKLAFSDGELFVMNADGSSVVQLTNNVGFRGQPAWSPDGSTIAFDCEVESGNTDICANNADGTGFRRLTLDPGRDSGAAFSPDGLEIAFAVTGDGSNSQIAIMNFDGTGVTFVGASGSQPAWSSDGTRIAFFEGTVCPDPEYCYCFDASYVMNRDGTEQQAIPSGQDPAWALSARPVAWFVSHCDELNCAFDGSGSWGGNGAMTYTWDFGDRVSGPGPTVTHAYAASGTYRVTLTVTDNAGVIATQSRDLVLNISPTARFTYTCSGWQCKFDASGSSDPDGSIASYSWNFGDGSGATGSIVTHIYNAAAKFTVTLTVADNRGATGRQQQVVDLSNLINVPPVPSFTPTCIALTCTFDGSSSSDPDGIITTYAWKFGDGPTASGKTTNHIYTAGGTYVVRLTVTDNIGATSFQDRSVTVITMHIGDLDGGSANYRDTWTATVTITVHDNNHGPVANATVSGSWSIGGTGSCPKTDSLGHCFVQKSTIPRSTKSVTFTIDSVTDPMFLYRSGDNHDPDGDSNGTSITVSQR